MLVVDSYPFLLPATEDSSLAGSYFSPKEGWRLSWPERLIAYTQLFTKEFYQYNCPVWTRDCTPLIL